MPTPVSSSTTSAVLPRAAAGDAQASAHGHGVDGVDDEVQEDLDEMALAAQDRQAVLDLGAQLDAAVLQPEGDALERLAQGQRRVHRFQAQLAGAGVVQEVGEDRCGPFGLLRDRRADGPTRPAGRACRPAP